jgi:hexosaminidase
VLCAGNEKTLVFIKDILEEITDIFPSEYIHIGGDECPKTSWAKCDKCQSKIKSLGIVADEKHSAEEKLQSYIISFAGKVLQEKGRKMIGWDEILEGGLAPGATVMSWRGMGGGIEAAKQSHDVIMTPNSFCYFDYYQTNDTKEEPLAIGGYLPVKTVYGFEPQPAGLTDAEKKFIIGVQANLWTEYVPDFKHAQYMVLPRMSALCEVQWSKSELKNYDRFLVRLPKLIQLYDKLAYNYAKHLFDISAEFNTNTSEGSLEVKLNTIDKAPVHYTLDGSAPTKDSPLFSGKIKISQNADIKAQVFRDNGKSRLFTEKVVFSKSSLKKITALQPENKSYKFNGVASLTDGLTGNRNYKTGRWIGFYNNDMEVVIDMAKSTSFSNVSIRTNVEKGDWIFDARSFEVEVSEDGQTFKSIAQEIYLQLTSESPNGINTHSLQFSETRARYVKVKASTEKTIPEWHGGKGKPAYLFVDEITIL